MDELRVPHDERRQRALEAFIAAYAEPHRHYHNFEHLADMLDTLVLRELEARQYNVLRLATFYHDIIYDPRGSANERRSADLARQTLSELGLPQETIERVGELILLTEKHEAPDADSDAQVFLGADLAILAAPADRYEAYSRAIRQEYAWAPERDYYHGRQAVLSALAQRSRIYPSELFQHWEDRARANIAAEIARIDGILETLDP